MGDYASGTNHVLPTYGYARMYSGVSLDSFQKKMTVQVRMRALSLLHISLRGAVLSWGICNACSVTDSILLVCLQRPLLDKCGRLVRLTARCSRPGLISHEHCPSLYLPQVASLPWYQPATLTDC